MNRSAEAKKPIKERIAAELARIALKTVADYYRAKGWTPGSILEARCGNFVWRKQVVSVGPGDSTTCKFLSLTIDGKPITAEGITDYYDYNKPFIDGWEKVGECPL